jgi:5,10-methylenetetrahydromethanopterin reductase
MRDLGVAIDGRTPIAQVAAQARAAEDGGAGTLWIACHLFLRDPITTAAIALSATRRISVGLMAMSPFSVHPVFTAMAAATLEEMFPGRLILCLGAGAPADLEAAGIGSQRPVKTLSEAIAVCRGLFAGGIIEHQGEAFRVLGRGLINGGRAIPVWLAASRPAMLALAGRAADGVLISAATSIAFARACLDDVAKAANGRPVRKAALVYARVGASEREAMDGVRRAIAFVLRGAHHARNIALSGAPLDQAALAVAYAAQDWAKVDHLVNDDVVRPHAACGTPAQVKARIEEYRAAGLDDVIIGGVNDAEGLAATLAAIGGKT